MVLLRRQVDTTSGLLVADYFRGGEEWPDEVTGSRENRQDGRQMDCVDQVNPKTGSSDCPQRAHLCNNPKYQALMAKECPKTCNKCKDSSTEPATTSSPNSRKPATSTQHPSPQTNSNCVDQVNPKTGSSDCPQRAHLCNNPKYQALMAKECPKTCNKCKDSSTEPATTSSPNSRKPATSTQHPSPQTNSNCVDQVNPKTGSSDCPQRAHLCNNPKYQALMAKECPKTCNKCKDSSTEPATTSSPNSRKPATSTQHPSPQTNSNCVDQVNPKTGSSDCPQRAHLCNNPKYQALMAKECPKTCNKCKDSSTEPATTSSPNSRKPAAAKPKQTNTNSARTSHCVDQVNPKTGFSDCPQRAYLCNNSKYQALMAKQCPKTCNKCRNSSANDTDKQPQTYNSDSHRAPKNCSDLINPHTGVSDCSMRKKLCNQPHYRSLMRQQCPKTCGFCS
ncbi:hypothetical protein RB195_016013 [Necator americanus]|uniref:ShKT domain-containing protein n=1 Tax=Necator americanus TaxID=51031 RepID=A0ABR1E7C3_NECAM